MQQGSWHRAVIDKLMICCDVQGRAIETWLGGNITPNKMYLFNLIQLWSYNGMMVSTISMMKSTNKWLYWMTLLKPTQVSGIFDDSVGYSLISLIQYLSHVYEQTKQIKVPNNMLIHPLHWNRIPILGGFGVKRWETPLTWNQSCLYVIDLFWQKWQILSSIILRRTW